MRHAYLFCQAGARVLFAFHWSQALSEGGSVPKEIRDQMFKPGMNHWGYGWFVTKMAPGEPGAGTTLEEMCGDMPGNYFSWILRYPEQDDVITVLRKRLWVHGTIGTKHSGDTLRHGTKDATTKREGSGGAGMVGAGGMGRVTSHAECACRPFRRSGDPAGGAPKEKNRNSKPGLNRERDSPSAARRIQIASRPPYACQASAFQPGLPSEEIMIQRLFLLMGMALRVAARAQESPKAELFPT